MIKYFVIYNLQGKIRLQKCYTHEKYEDATTFLKSLFQLVNNKIDHASNFFSINNLLQGCRVVYRRYASLYFVTVIDSEESDLAIFDLIHMIAEGLDIIFENASELDVMFNPDRVHLFLDEIIVGGTIVETNIKEAIDAYQMHSDIRKKK